jgi:hypothetical protein
MFLKELIQLDDSVRKYRYQKMKMKMRMKLKQLSSLKVVVVVFGVDAAMSSCPYTLSPWVSGVGGTHATVPFLI